VKSYHRQLAEETWPRWGNDDMCQVT